MKRNQERSSADGYCIQILMINSDIQNHIAEQSYYIENIGKGGFRFISDLKLELEDRLAVVLHFPDQHVQQVRGRICYSEQVDAQFTAYGFSVIDGFYSLRSSAKQAITLQNNYIKTAKPDQQ